MFSFFFFILPCAPKRKLAVLFDLRRLQHIDEWNKTLSLLIMRQNVSFFPIIFSARLLWKLQNKAADIKKREFISAFYMIQKGTGGMHCMKNPSQPINTAFGLRNPWPVTHCRVGKYPYVRSFLSFCAVCSWQLLKEKYWAGWRPLWGPALWGHTGRPAVE